MLAGLAVACGDDGPVDVEPTATPGTQEPTPADTGITINTEDMPPILTVAAGQESIEAGLGSFCWTSPAPPSESEVLRRCVDRSTTTPVESLAAMGATELGAALAAETITEVVVRATSTAELTSEPLNDSLLAWTGGEGEPVNLPATADGGALHVDISTLQPGQYLVTFFVRFEGGGDASYGLVLEQGQ